MNIKFLAGFYLVSFVAITFCLAEAANESISSVRTSAISLNSANSEKIDLFYKLAKHETVTVSVYDSDGGLVRHLAEKALREAGENKEVWDGKDAGGKPVPDEAYTFTIETASGAIYDSTTFSGGMMGDITKAHFDRGAGTVVYSLPAPSRVLIRLGVRNGPMHKTLVDWKSRIAGNITEYWDGRDEDKLINLRENKEFNALITYVTLPDATVIAYGNDKEAYRDYKLGWAKDWPKKPVRERVPDAKGRMRPENLVPPASSRSPKVLMSFPKLAEDGKKTFPTVSGVVDIRVDVDPTDKDALAKEQFEIIFYADNIFFAEAERGYLPYNWRWELNQLAPGEHMLTVNISSFKGQVGVASRKVKVIKP